MSDHRAKKQLGQHFLHDAAIIDRIVRAINPHDGDRIVEIGPGQGALTIPLLKRHGALTVIEFDRDLLPGLDRIAATHGALEVINADVLTVDLTAVAAAAPMRLVGNLPYNISSPILFHALDHAPAIRDMHFMLQKEVVERMAAGPGSKVYGRLSVMLQAFAQVTPLFGVPPGAFRPPPAVDSAVVRLVPRAAASIGVQDGAAFSELVKAAFAQRRKTLRNALSQLADADQIRAADVDPGARAEDVTVLQFVQLANDLARRRAESAQKA